MDVGGWLAWLLLWTMLIVALAVEGPTEAEIKAACKGHGKVVSYTPDTIWSVDAKARAVCADGAIRYVGQD